MDAPPRLGSLQLLDRGDRPVQAAMPGRHRGWRQVSRAEVYDIAGYAPDR